MTGGGSLSVGGNLKIGRLTLNGWVLEVNEQTFSIVTTTATGPQEQLSIDADARMEEPVFFIQVPGGSELAMNNSTGTYIHQLTYTVSTASVDTSSIRLYTRPPVGYSGDTFKPLEYKLRDGGVLLSQIDAPLTNAISTDGPIDCSGFKFVTNSVYDIMLNRTDLRNPILNINANSVPFEITFIQSTPPDGSNATLHFEVSKEAVVKVTRQLADGTGDTEIATYNTLAADTQTQITLAQGRYRYTVDAQDTVVSSNNKINSVLVYNDKESPFNRAVFLDGSNAKITVKADDISYPIRYKVESSDTSDGTYNPVTDGSLNSINDTNDIVITGDSSLYYKITYTDAYDNVLVEDPVLLIKDAYVEALTDLVVTDGSSNVVRFTLPEQCNYDISRKKVGEAAYVSIHTGTGSGLVEETFPRENDTALVDGSYNYKVTYVDAYNNTNSNELVNAVVFDRTPPAFSVTKFQDGSSVIFDVTTAENNVSLEVVYGDTPVVARIKQGLGDADTHRLPFTTINNGTYTFTFKAYDIYDNMTTVDVSGVFSDTVTSISIGSAVFNALDDAVEIEFTTDEPGTLKISRTNTTGIPSTTTIQNSYYLDTSGTRKITYETFGGLQINNYVGIDVFTLEFTDDYGNVNTVSHDIPIETVPPNIIHLTSADDSDLFQFSLNNALPSTNIVFRVVEQVSDQLYDNSCNVFDGTGTTLADGTFNGSFNWPAAQLSDGSGEKKYLLAVHTVNGGEVGFFETTKCNDTVKIDIVTVDGSNVQIRGTTYDQSGTKTFSLMSGATTLSTEQITSATDSSYTHVFTYTIPPGDTSATFSVQVVDHSNGTRSSVSKTVSIKSAGDYELNSNMFLMSKAKRSGVSNYPVQNRKYRPFHNDFGAAYRALASGLKANVHYDGGIGFDPELVSDGYDVRVSPMGSDKFPSEYKIPFKVEVRNQTNFWGLTPNVIRIASDSSHVDIDYPHGDTSNARVEFNIHLAPLARYSIRLYVASPEHQHPVPWEPAILYSGSKVEVESWLKKVEVVVDKDLLVVNDGGTYKVVAPNTGDGEIPFYVRPASEHDGTNGFKFERIKTPISGLQETINQSGFVIDDTDVTTISNPNQVTQNFGSEMNSQQNKVRRHSTGNMTVSYVPNENKSGTNGIGLRFITNVPDVGELEKTYECKICISKAHLFMPTDYMWGMINFYTHPTQDYIEWKESEKELNFVVKGKPVERQNIPNADLSIYASEDNRFKINVPSGEDNINMKNFLIDCGLTSADASAASAELGDEEFFAFLDRTFVVFNTVTKTLLQTVSVQHSIQITDGTFLNLKDDAAGVWVYDTTGVRCKFIDITSYLDRNGNTTQATIDIRYGGTTYDIELFVDNMCFYVFDGTNSYVFDRFDRIEGLAPVSGSKSIQETLIDTIKEHGKMRITYYHYGTDDQNRGGDRYIDLNGVFTAQYHAFPDKHLNYANDDIYADAGYPLRKEFFGTESFSDNMSVKTEGRSPWYKLYGAGAAVDFSVSDYTSVVVHNYASSIKYLDVSEQVSYRFEFIAFSQSAMTDLRPQLHNAGFTVIPQYIGTSSVTRDDNVVDPLSDRRIVPPRVGKDPFQGDRCLKWSFVAPHFKPDYSVNTTGQFSLFLTQEQALFFGIDITDTKPVQIINVKGKGFTIDDNFGFGQTTDGSKPSALINLDDGTRKDPDDTMLLSEDRDFKVVRYGITIDPDDYPDHNIFGKGIGLIFENIHFSAYDNQLRLNTENDIPIKEIIVFDYTAVQSNKWRQIGYNVQTGHTYKLDQRIKYEKGTKMFLSFYFNSYTDASSFANDYIKEVKLIIEDESEQLYNGDYHSYAVTTENVDASNIRITIAVDALYANSITIREGAGDNQREFNGYYVRPVVVSSNDTVSGLQKIEARRYLDNPGNAYFDVTVTGVPNRATEVRLVGEHDLTDKDDGSRAVKLADGMWTFVNVYPLSDFGHRDSELKYTMTYYDGSAWVKEVDSSDYYLHTKNLWAHNTDSDVKTIQWKNSENTDSTLDISIGSTTVQSSDWSNKVIAVIAENGGTLQSVSGVLKIKKGGQWLSGTVNALNETTTVTLSDTESVLMTLEPSPYRVTVDLDASTVLVQRKLTNFAFTVSNEIHKHSEVNELVDGTLNYIVHFTANQDAELDLRDEFGNEIRTWEKRGLRTAFSLTMTNSVHAYKLRYKLLDGVRYRIQANPISNRLVIHRECNVKFETQNARYIRLYRKYTNLVRDENDDPNYTEETKMNSTGTREVLIGVDGVTREGTVDDVPNTNKEESEVLVNSGHYQLRTYTEYKRINGERLLYNASSRMRSNAYFSTGVNVEDSYRYFFAEQDMTLPVIKRNEFDNYFSKFGTGTVRVEFNYIAPEKKVDIGLAGQIFDTWAFPVESSNNDSNEYFGIVDGITASSRQKRVVTYLAPGAYEFKLANVWNWAAQENITYASIIGGVATGYGYANRLVHIENKNVVYNFSWNDKVKSLNERSVVPQEIPNNETPYIDVSSNVARAVGANASTSDVRYHAVRFYNLAINEGTFTFDSMWYTRNDFNGTWYNTHASVESVNGTRVVLVSDKLSEIPGSTQTKMVFVVATNGTSNINTNHLEISEFMNRGTEAVIVHELPISQYDPASVYFNVGTNKYINGSVIDFSGDSSSFNVVTGDDAPHNVTSAIPVGSATASNNTVTINNSLTDSIVWVNVINNDIGVEEYGNATEALVGTRKVSNYLLTRRIEVNSDTFVIRTRAMAVDYMVRSTISVDTSNVTCVAFVLNDTDATVVDSSSVVSLTETTTRNGLKTFIAEAITHVSGRAIQFEYTITGYNGNEIKYATVDEVTYAPVYPTNKFADDIIPRIQVQGDIYALDASGYTPVSDVQLVDQFSSLDVSENVLTYYNVGRTVISAGSYNKQKMHLQYSYPTSKNLCSLKLARGAGTETIDLPNEGAGVWSRIAIEVGTSVTEMRIENEGDSYERETIHIANWYFYTPTLPLITFGLDPTITRADGKQATGLMGNGTEANMDLTVVAVLFDDDKTTTNLVSNGHNIILYTKGYTIAQGTKPASNDDLLPYTNNDIYNDFEFTTNTSGTAFVVKSVSGRFQNKLIKTIFFNVNGGELTPLGDALYAYHNNLLTIDSQGRYMYLQNNSQNFKSSLPNGQTFDNFIRLGGANSSHTVFDNITCLPYADPTIKITATFPNFITGGQKDYDGGTYIGIREVDANGVAVQTALWDGEFRFDSSDSDAGYAYWGSSSTNSYSKINVLRGETKYFDIVMSSAGHYSSTGDAWSLEGGHRFCTQASFTVSESNTTPEIEINISNISPFVPPKTFTIRVKNPSNSRYMYLARPGQNYDIAYEFDVKVDALNPDHKIYTLTLSQPLTTPYMWIYAYYRNSGLWSGKQVTGPSFRSISASHNLYSDNPTLDLGTKYYNWYNGLFYDV